MNLSVRFESKDCGFKTQDILYKIYTCKFNSNLLPLWNTCAFAFFRIQYPFGRHFLGSFWAPSSRPFWWNRCQKNGFSSEQIWSWERGKSHRGPDGGNMGVFQNCNVRFCKKLTDAQGCVIRSVNVMERPCVGFPKAPSLVMHCLIRLQRMSLRHRSFRIPTPRPNNEPNRL